jgi:dihydropteroate synthase
MGILNVTPNSFYDGGKYFDEKSSLNQVNKMITEGATFIDIGAYSSKPGAEFVSEEDEINRLIPVIKLVLKHFPDTLISVDTFRSTVAKSVIDAGACMINDISAGCLDENMLNIDLDCGHEICIGCYKPGLKCYYN